MHAMLILVLVALVAAAFFIPLLERLADAGRGPEDEMRFRQARHPQRFHD